MRWLTIGVQRAELAGLAGGLLASFVMERFQALWPSPGGSDDDPATVKAADAISREVAGRPLPDSAKALAGESVHYAFGAFLGVTYGLSTQLAPRIVTLGSGMGFGVAVALLADDVAVPALKLSKPLTQISLGKHAYGIASHLVFGLATEGVRRAALRGLAHKRW